MDASSGKHDLVVGVGTTVQTQTWGLSDDPEWHMRRFAELGDGDTAVGFNAALELPEYAQIPEDLLDELERAVFGELSEDKALDTDPDPSPKPSARRLRRYWTRGEGAAKIRWGEEGDFYRCVRHLSKYVAEPKGLCNVYHRAALGGNAPGQGPHTKDLLAMGLIDGRNYVDTKRFSDVEREKYAETGVALPDGSFPIPDAEHVSIAISMLHHAKDKAKAKAHIIKRAKALDAMDRIPSSWGGTRSEQKVDDAMSMEFKSVGVTEVKEPEKGILEAIVSVTGVVDRVNDVIQPGAYEKTLKSRLPKGIWQHSWDSPISKTLDVKELMPGDPSLPSHLPNGNPWPAQAGALKVKMQFNLDTQRGRDAYSDILFYDDQQEWSIGYQVPPGGATVDTKTGQRHITYLDLYEYSPVLFGAMPATHTSTVRQAQTAMKSLKSAVAVEANAEVAPTPAPAEDVAEPAPIAEDIDAEASLPTFVDAVARYLGPQEGKPTTLADIYDWAQTADDADDDDTELDALSGMLTQVDLLLEGNSEPDYQEPLQDLRENLAAIFMDFEGEDSEMSEPEEEDYDPYEKSDPGQITLSIKDLDAFMEQSDLLAQIASTKNASQRAPLYDEDDEDLGLEEDEEDDDEDWDEDEWDDADDDEDDDLDDEDDDEDSEENASRHTAKPTPERQ